MLNDNWNDPSCIERSNLIFRNKNKDYGAYEIRIQYKKRLVVSFLYTISLVLVVLLIPFIKSLINKNNAHEVLQVSEEIILSNPPPIDKLDPPPPPLIIPPSIMQTIKFVPPVVTDRPVEEEQPPPQEKMMNVQVGTQTQEGSNESEPLPEMPIVPNPEEDKIFTYVEEMPSFPGGEAKMMQFIQSHVRYPPLAQENNVEGRVFVKFMVDKEGKIRDASVLKGIGSGCDEEALRVINSMPDWTPGKQNGRNVKVGSITIYIVFQLN